MKRSIVIILIFLTGQLYAQWSVDSVLVQVERNNTTLSAIRKKLDAEKLANQTGIFLKNPEAEFNYLWGNPSAIGNRTDVSVRQSFDFPTAYVYRKQISNLKNDQIELEYQKQKKEILLQVRLLCTELTYRNALKAAYVIRLSNARQLAGSYQRKHKAGEISVLECNKAQVHLLTMSKEAENQDIERAALLSELTGLNGGTALYFKDSAFVLPHLPGDFDIWFAQAEQGSPVMQWLKQEIVIAQKEKQWQNARNLPGFSSGYMSEKVAGEHFQGITFGVTIPLWETKNSVKLSQARIKAAEEWQADAKLQF